MQLCGILTLAFILFAISAIGIPHLIPPHDNTPKLSPEPHIPPPDNVRDEGPHFATIEYGAPDMIKDNLGPLYTYIRFPQGGHSTDATIYEWVYSLYGDIVAAFQTVQETEPSAIGEINIHFDSYLIDNRYAGILMRGEFSYELTMSPEEVLKPFNIDLLNGTLLDSSDILDFTQIDKISDVLYQRMMIEHPEIGRYLDFIDESWLYHVVIGHDGIIVVLQRNFLITESLTTLSVTLPYEELGSALLIRNEPPLVAVPTPTPDMNIDEPPFDDPPPDDPPFDDPPFDDPSDPDPDDPPSDEPPSDEPPDPDPDDPFDLFPDVAPQRGEIDPSKPMIALTFDDGPGVYTDQFLDLFEQYGVRATFCTIGNLVNTQNEALVRAVGMGSEVIGHSWDHKNLAKLSADDVKKQISETSKAIEAVTGVTIQKFKPPYGAVSNTMRDVAKELGFAIVCWSVDSEDWSTRDADAIFFSVMQQVSSGSIVLSHEMYKSTLDAYTRLIPELLFQGYQLVTVSELLYHTRGELISGEVYYEGIR
jgi:peptidoglycan/xylan/chitin deacetylase (PgdA/CDA1 family)